MFVSVEPSTDNPENISFANYILAGRIIEIASGMSYPDYINQYVFAPAGLQHTSYCLPQPAGMATGYYVPGNQYKFHTLNVSAVFSAGGLCSTVGDLLLWSEALANGKVVSPESYQKMITPVQFSDSAFGPLGYGLYVKQDAYGQQIGFLGAEASFHSYLFWYPEKGLTVVLLSNTGNVDNKLMAKLQAEIPVLMP